MLISSSGLLYIRSHRRFLSGVVHNLDVRIFLKLDDFSTIRLGNDQVFDSSTGCDGPVEKYLDVGDEARSLRHFCRKPEFHIVK